MKPTQNFIFSLLFFFSFYLYHFPLLAQDTIPSPAILIQKDTSQIVIIETDLTLPDQLPEEVTPKNVQEPESHPKFLSGIELGLDVLKFAGLFLNFETKYEGSVGIIFRNIYVISFEAGQGNLTPKRAYKNADYTSDGRYGRIGLNYIMRIDEKNLLIPGIRYGQSNFSEVIDVKLENYFGYTYEDLIIRNNLKAHWYEITLGTESEMINRLFFGSIIRLRILGKLEDIEPFDVYSIPGYGRAFDKIIPAINFYIKYRINF